MNSILLAGGGGHCHSCIDVIESEGRLSIQGIIQPAGAASENVMGYPTVGTDDDLAELIGAGAYVLVTIGQVKTADPRIRLYNLVKECGGIMPNVVSSAAYVSARSVLGEGTIIMHGAIVNAASEVGRNCIVNSHALLEHDVFIGDHCHISTGARINGGVNVGSGSFIGSGAIIREGINVGAGAVVGAGQVILKDVPEGSVMRGLL
tara:strand:+ start:1984 stop:2601 length:618 start_codon:yes stop_codon:yes gene_type:complete